MWHEIRKQERKIRCMIVDYKRRAERRRDYYEKIKADPTQFLQIHGRSCKINLDAQIAAAGDSPAVMMSWQGGQDVQIDRFDVRAHLDYIPEYKGSPDDNLSYDERLINYERYRILVQNDFLGVSEEKFLHQIHLEEQFGAVKPEPQVLEGKKKVPGAAIGYNYDDPTADVSQPQPLAPPLPVDAEPEDPVDEEDEDDSDIDFDMCVDVNKVSTPQAHELNNCGHIYGMDGNDFFSFLTKDREEADNLRLAKELEEEKAMYSGRKSRRERRAYRDKKLAGRKISPPSYASRKSPTYRDYCDLARSSRSKSNSPLNSGKITYITSFSGEEQPSGSSPKLIKNLHKSSNDDYRTVKYRSRTPDNRRHRYRSRTRSRSLERTYRDRRRSRSRSRSSSSRSRFRRRSRSPPPTYHRSRSPPPTYHRSRSPPPTHHRLRSPLPTHHRLRSPPPTYHRSRSPPSNYRRSRSPHSTYHRSSSQREYNRSRSKSKSPLRPVRTSDKPTFNPAVPVKQPAPPIISRYYGRRAPSSSSELSLTEDEDQDDNNKSSSHKKPWSDFGNSSGRNKAGPSAAMFSLPKLTPQERLKKKMQALLNKQYKADKKAEREKKEKEEQERIDREDEMREMSIKLRKRERRRRHEHLSDRRSGSSQSGSSRNSRSRSRSWSPAPRHRRKRRSYSRSRSRSRSEERVEGPRSEEKVEGPRPLVDY